MMNLLPRGELTLAIEVTNISQHGFWILTDEQEFFYHIKIFPGFKMFQ